MRIPGKVNVLIVDDSAVVRQVLSAVLEADPDINVLGAVPDPIFAMRRMNADWPDVVVLDLEMPRMDGITFLRKLMGVRPTPVVVCSTLTQKGAQTTMQALAAGAVEVVAKPASGLKQFLESDAGELVRAVKAAAAGNMHRMRAVSTRMHAIRARGTEHSAGPRPTETQHGGALPVTTDRLVALGTSTGGTQALEYVLTRLPRVLPGIVIVQHMPARFTAAFAARLNGLCRSDICEAQDGDRVLPGRVLIAPGGLHMSVRRDGAQYRVRVADGPPVNRHKPSVDVLFTSVAEAAGANALGVIMTGMGDDGARGLKLMRDAGARTVAQDEASCVVYGMPAEAVKRGAAMVEAPLDGIPALIERFAAQAEICTSGGT